MFSQQPYYYSDYTSPALANCDKQKYRNSGRHNQGELYGSKQGENGLYIICILLHFTTGRGQLICVGTRAETRFRLSAKRTSPFKSAGASVQSTTDSRVVRISGSNVGYTMFRSSVKGNGYPLHSPISPYRHTLRICNTHRFFTATMGKRKHLDVPFIRTFPVFLLLPWAISHTTYSFVRYS
jgi:hypothetical protein